jgi:RimJ/RimL family protein N-acetyltransferase
MITRETPRLLLRPPIASDLDVFIQIHEDPDVMRYMNVTGTARSRTAGWRTLALIIGHWHLRGYGQWAVIEKSTGRLIGRAGLWNPEGGFGLEVGWVIAQASWGRGFATEAARASVQYGFDIVGADRLISLIHPDNTRSIRVAEKIGMTFEREDLQDGAPVLIYGIDKPGN